MLSKIIGAQDLIEKVFDGIIGVVDELDISGDKKAELHKELAQLQQEAKKEANRHEEEIKSLQRDVLLAEIQGDSWLQRNWRPIFMFVLIAIVANNFLIAPYADAMFGSSVMLELPSHLWTLITTAMGGYIGLRTFEKHKGVSANRAAPKKPALTDEAKERLRKGAQKMTPKGVK